MAIKIKGNFFAAWVFWKGSVFYGVIDDVDSISGCGCGIGFSEGIILNAVYFKIWIIFGEIFVFEIICSLLICNNCTVWLSFDIGFIFEGVSIASNYSIIEIISGVIVEMFSSFDPTVTFELKLIPVVLP